jgi:hypothetical protein
MVSDPSTDPATVKGILYKLASSLVSYIFLKHVTAHFELGRTFYKNQLFPLILLAWTNLLPSVQSIERVHDIMVNARNDVI